MSLNSYLNVSQKPPAVSLYICICTTDTIAHFPRVLGIKNLKTEQFSTTHLTQEWTSSLTQKKPGNSLFRFDAAVCCCSCCLSFSCYSCYCCCRLVSCKMSKAQYIQIPVPRVRLQQHKAPSDILCVGHGSGCSSSACFPGLPWTRSILPIGLCCALVIYFAFSMYFCLRQNSYKLTSKLLAIPFHCVHIKDWICYIKILRACLFAFIRNSYEFILLQERNRPKQKKTLLNF